jgi:hypothetical protein
MDLVDDRVNESIAHLARPLVRQAEHRLAHRPS